MATKMAKILGDTVKVLENHDAEAESYVDAIMSTQGAVKVDSPAVNRKKRNLSGQESNDVTTKKVRNGHTAKDCYSDAGNETGDASSEDTVSDDQQERARRRASRNKRSKASQRNIFQVAADVHTDPDPSDVSVKQLLSALSADMHKMYTSLHDRIDKFEAGLEERISSKVAQLLDKRVNNELKKIRKDVDERLDTFKENFKEEISEELGELNDKLSNINVSGPVNDRSLNVVIRGLPESSNENINSKVNTMIKDGLQIRNVSVKSAERKVSKSPSKPGVVIATFKNGDDKRKVMTDKSSLKDSRQYKDIYINHDQSREQRLMTSNFKAVLDAINRNDNDLSLRGTRVIRRNRDNQNSHEGERRQSTTQGRDRSQSGRRSSNNSSNAGSNRDMGHGNSGTRRGNDRGHRRGGRGSRGFRGRNSY